MPRNRLRVCTARHLLPAKTGTRIPGVVLIYLKTHEKRHMRYSLFLDIAHKLCVNVIKVCSNGGTAYINSKLIAKANYFEHSNCICNANLCKSYSPKLLNRIL